jgi:trimeric autotransporter adhesin
MLAQHRKFIAICSITFCLCVLLSGCGGGGSKPIPTPTPTSNPTPTVSSLSPTNVLAGTSSQTLTINGTNFVSSSTVTFNSSAHTATFVSASQLTIALTSADLTGAGKFNVVVSNPTPGGGSSAAAAFTVNNPIPIVMSISPASVTVGAPAQTLTITGSGFVTGATATLGGSAVTPTFVSSTQLTVALTTAEAAAIGSYAVVVTNPAPDAGPSTAAVDLVVTGPVLAGNVWKGASVGSTVTAYEVGSDGSSGTAIGTATTDANGNFSLALTALPPGAVRLTASAGTYTSEFDGTTITGTSSISALLDTATASISGIEITPASEFVSSRTAGLLKAGTVTSEVTAHAQAEALIVGYIGLSSKAVIEQLAPVFDKPDITANPDAFTLGLYIGALATEGHTAVPSSPDDLIHSLS